jgi:hypothetical protein
MDGRVVDDPLYRDRMTNAFLSLPVVSIVCQWKNLFDDRIGLYVHSQSHGESWERACSAELIEPDGKRGFQIDCGIRMQGGQSRVPSKSPKHSFRLLFKAQYGPSKLHYRLFQDSPVNEFNTVVLRADYNNSWLHWDAEQRQRGQRSRDAWMKDSQRAMSWTSGHNRYAHLFLNGLYWGVYDVAERPDASFAAAYLGGSREDYDIIEAGTPREGTIDAFNALNSVRGLAGNAGYGKLQQQLSLPEFMDYLLLNYYAGNQDVGEYKNWYAIRRRSPPGKFQFLVWDGEQVLHDLRDDTVNSPGEAPFRLAEELRANPEYRLAFADRVRKHLLDDGALCSAAVIARWMKRAQELDRAIIAESARWGYYRRTPPFTRDQDWLAEQRRLVESYFPQRAAILLRQLRVAGLYPRIAAPVFHPSGGPLGAGLNVSINSESGGVVYFTLNGADPRVSGRGDVAAEAQPYTNIVAIQPPVQLKARFLKAGVWSALTEAAFTKPAK